MFESVDYCTSDNDNVTRKTDRNRGSGAEEYGAEPAGNEAYGKAITAERRNQACFRRGDTDKIRTTPSLT
ncbi:MAG: hypothetical protein IJ130_03850 [Solobacterium sp.]|nr:hypothetical protein [Solobacterium sp.]